MVKPDLETIPCFPSRLNSSGSEVLLTASIRIGPEVSGASVVGAGVGRLRGCSIVTLTFLLLRCVHISIFSDNETSKTIILSQKFEFS